MSRQMDAAKSARRFRGEYFLLSVPSLSHTCGIILVESTAQTTLVSLKLSKLSIASAAKIHFIGTLLFFLSLPFLFFSYSFQKIDLNGQPPKEPNVLSFVIVRNSTDLKNITRYNVCTSRLIDVSTFSFVSQRAPNKRKNITHLTEGSFFL